MRRLAASLLGIALCVAPLAGSCNKKGYCKKP